MPESNMNPETYEVQHESVLLIPADKSVAALIGKQDESGHSRVIVNYGGRACPISEFAG